LAKAAGWVNRGMMHGASFWIEVCSTQNSSPGNSGFQKRSKDST
jgi:hypothetical protein